MKLLIADDELATRLVLTRAAQFAGHEVRSVADGRELIDTFPDFKPDAILVDWDMPVVNGLDALREIRKMPGGDEAFIIVITGLSGGPETARALDADVDDYFLKPVSVSRLRVLLTLTESRIASRRSAGDANGRGNARGGSPSEGELLAAMGSTIGIDLQGRVSFANCALGGHVAGDLLGRPIDTLLAHALDKLAEASLQAADTGQPGRVPVQPGEPDWIVRAIRRGPNLIGFVLHRDATAVEPQSKAANG